MKNKYIFVFVLLFSLLVISFGFTNIYVSQNQLTEEEDFVVVTSFYPMYIATMNVIGDTEGITLKNLSEPQTGCLHDFQLTPADMKLLSTADVFVINGGGIESFMEDIAKQYPDLLIIEACDGIELLSEAESHGHDHEEVDAAGYDIEVHDHEAEDIHVEMHDSEIHDHEAEDIHAEEHELEIYGHDIELEHNQNEDAHSHDINAHAWMSVELYRKQVKNIANGLEAAQLKFAEHFQSNAEAYDKKLEELQKEQEKLLTVTQGEEVIMFHCAYDYVAEDLGLEVAFCMDLDEERQVSAGEVAEVLEIIKNHDVRYIFAEELYGSDMCEMVQKEADVEVIYLDSLNRGEYQAWTYLEGMRNNLKLISEVFQD